MISIVPTKEELSRILRAEVTAARIAYESAHTAFQASAADIPSHLPFPDSTDRIINAGKVYRSRMDAYHRALREFNNFVLTGEAPGRLTAGMEKRE